MSVNIKTGTLTRVDGSSEWTSGSTISICSVSGPLEVKQREEIPDKATVELVVRPVIGLQTTRESLIQSVILPVISSCLVRERNPQSLFQIVIQSLEPGEPIEYTSLEIAAGINSCTAALLDAGAPLRGIAVAAAAFITADGNVHWQPNLHFFTQYADQITSSHVISYCLVAEEDPKLLLCESNGDFSKSDVFKLLETAAATQCPEIYKHLRKAMKHKLENDFIWRAK